MNDLNELKCQELIETIDHMIRDKVQLVHAGQMLDWEDTKIPEIIERIKAPYRPTIKIIPPGTLLKNKFSGQINAVINDNGTTVSMIITNDVLTYPKKWITAHFEIKKPNSHRPE